MNEIKTDIDITNNIAFEIPIDPDISNITFDAEFGSTDQSIFRSEEISVETSDYNALDNLPRINNVILRGSKTSGDYKLQDQMEPITESEIDKIIFGKEEG